MLCFNRLEELVGNHSAGMSRNPFGGRDRLDKCNLQGPSLLAGMIVDVVSGTPGERTMITEIFRDAIFNYLFFGLGKNGTSADEFFAAAEFLLRIRASDSSTWKGARYLRETFKDDTGKRVKRTLVFTDEELRSMCADHLWHIGEWPYDFPTFIKQLRETRRQILEENFAQARAYTEFLRSRTDRRIESGENYSPAFLSRDFVDVLVDPSVNPDDLTELIGHQPRQRSRRHLNPNACRAHQCRNQRTAEVAATGDLFAVEVDTPELAVSTGCSSSQLSA